MRTKLFLFFTFLSTLAGAQDFSFSPGAQVEGEIDVDGYGVHQIDIVNQTEDTIWLTWRIVEFTMPSGWDVNLCDNVQCYGQYPNMADMNPIAPASAGYIRLTTYPMNIAGSGVMKLWIYKTGYPEEHSTISFLLSAGITGASEPLHDTVSVFPNPTAGPLNIKIPGSSPVSWSLFDPSGRVRLQGDTQEADLSGLPEGVYWLQLPGAFYPVYKN